MTASDALHINGVCKAYGPHTVLNDIDLVVATGSRTAIVGPSGSGKTTLLRIIAGFETPDSGSVMLGSVQMANGPTAVPAHKRGIGFVPQDGALFPHLSIADNIGFGLARNAPDRAERIAELMDMVSLDAAMLKRWPHELSGGQQQRVALARALALRPALMLLDEPFSALDTGLRASTRKAVAQLLSKAGVTTILVTHDQAEALSFADQVAVMRAGQLVQAGPPRELYLHPKDPAIASFLGESMVLPAQLTKGWADCALGRVSVSNQQRIGSAQIMLRPEQLHIALIPTVTSIAPAERPSVYGSVVDCDFGGAECIVTVELAQALRVTVHCPSSTAPVVGTRVTLSVSGNAHVFDSTELPAPPEEPQGPVLASANVVAV